MLRLSERPPRMRRAGIAMVLAVGLVNACGPAAGPSPTSGSPDATAAAIVSPEPSPFDSPSRAPATPSTAPTLPLETTAAGEPTVAATTKPTTTLSCTATVKDPVYLGEKAKVTLTCPVGATCELIVHYPNGEVADLPAATHPSPGWWQWTWTVPPSARAGEARGVAVCTDGGKQVSKAAGFTLKAVPWSIQVSIPSPFDHTTLPEHGLVVTVTIHGTMPVNPSYDVQQVVCSFVLTPEAGGQYSDGIDTGWNNGDGPLTLTLQKTFSEADIGTASWTMKCRNYYVDPAQWKYDSGTIEIT